VWPTETLCGLNWEDRLVSVVRNYATAETTMKNQYRQIKMLPLNNGNATAAVIILRLRKLILNSQELINGDEIARMPAAATASRIEDGTCGPQGTKTNHRSNSKTQHERQDCEQHSICHRTLPQDLLNAS
jgi:hypothetical protein